MKNHDMPYEYLRDSETNKLIYKVFKGVTVFAFHALMDSTDSLINL